MFTLLALSFSAPATATPDAAALMPASQSALVLMSGAESRYHEATWESAKVLMWSGLPIAVATPDQSWLLRSEGALSLVSLDDDGREVRRWTGLDAVAQLNHLADTLPSGFASR